LPDIQRHEDRVVLALHEAFANLRRYLQNLLDDTHKSDNGLLTRDEFNLALIDKTIRSMRSDLPALGFQEATMRELEAIANIADEIAAEYGEMDIQGGFERGAAKGSFTQASRAQIAMLATGAEYDLVQVQADVSNQLTQVLMRGTIGGLNLGELMTEVSAVLDTNLARARTLIATTLSSFNRMTSVSHARDLGIKWFRFDGPNDSVIREWCSHWEGRIGTVEMIEASTDEWGRDDQPLPAMSWGGGWNCRHRWTPIDESTIGEYEQGPA
jgi:hypothetical protein